MDNLDNLPPKEDTNSTSQETEVMGKFFKQPAQKSSHSPPRDPPRGHPQGAVARNEPYVKDLEPEGINWKEVGLVTTLFLALANPWIDMLLCKIPYCGDNAFTLLGIKTLMFAIIYLIITIFFG